VVTDHRQRLIRESALLLAEVVQVLVVAPGEHDVVKTAAFTVDAVLGAVHWGFGVWIVDKGARVDDAILKRTADCEGVAYDIPLAFGTVEEEELAKIVDQAGQPEPLWLIIATDGLSGLQQVLDLGEGGIWIGLVDEIVELLHRFPGRHLSTCLELEIVPSFGVVRHGLLLVLLAVEVLDARSQASSYWWNWILSLSASSRDFSYKSTSSWVAVPFFTRITAFRTLTSSMVSDVASRTRPSL
jgi:hypothetical protein